MNEASAISDEIPVSGEAAETLEVEEADGTVLEDFVRGLGAVDHLPFGVMAGDGSAAEAFEDTDLDFVGGEGDETVEAGGEALEGFAWEAGDEIGVDVDGGLFAEEAEVIFEALEILASADSVGDFEIEGLDADFELECAWWETDDPFPQGVGEAVGDHLEVEEEIRAIVFEEEGEDGAAAFDVKIERTIDELERLDAARKEAFEGWEKAGERECADCGVQGRETEFAREGAAAGGFYIDDAMGDVVVGVEVVRQGELVQVRQGGVDQFKVGAMVIEEVMAEAREGKVGFACDDVIGELNDGLERGFVGDFGAAEDDEEIRAKTFKECDEFGGRCDVPDVDAEAEYARIGLEDAFGDIERALLEIELEELGLGLEGAEVGEEIAEAEGGVNVFGVDGGEEDVRHRLVEGG
jgi:hypothetical protein